MPRPRLGGSLPEFYGAVVVGERGQIVIPAKARRDMGIAPGDKLLVLRGPQGNMLMATKSDSLLKMLGEAMKTMSKFEETLKKGDKAE
jgi:AbrB family looped-hinge helix DNA binding protein